jgi:ABC-type Fe3+/spermidine/putrescine transport system ATPase subunit
MFLMDEPLGHLEAYLRVQLRAEIRRLHERLDITTVYITHDQQEAAAVSDRIAVMHDGRLQQVGSLLDLLDRPINRFVAEFIGQSNVFEGEPTRGGLSFGGTVLPGTGTGRYLVVRPEQVRITPAGTVSGTVLETQFAGGMSTIVVAPDGVATASGQPVLVRQPGPAGVERGAAVSLTWDAETAVLVP